MRHCIFSKHMGFDLPCNCTIKKIDSTMFHIKSEKYRVNHQDIIYLLSILDLLLGS